MPVALRFYVWWSFTFVRVQCFLYGHVGLHGHSSPATTINGTGGTRFVFTCCRHSSSGGSYHWRSIIRVWYRRDICVISEYPSPVGVVGSLEAYKE